MNNINESCLSNQHRALLLHGTDSEAHFGFECSDGWVPLIDGTLRLASRYATEHGLELRIDHIKEKFGVLRTYHRGGDLTIDRIFDVAELVSSRTCEICGDAGKLREANGWLQTRCLKHQLPNSPVSIGLTHSEFYAVSYAKSVSLILWFFGDKYTPWLTRDCVALGGVKPVEALATPEGCQQICTLLQRIQHGVIP